MVVVADGSIMAVAAPVSPSVIADIEVSQINAELVV